MDKVKLLIVDDEDALRTLVKTELQTRGFDTDDAENGEIALDKLNAQHYNLVVLDIRMPGMDGLEVLRHIRQHDLADKVIMLTGVDELKIARETLQLGANDFLTKPNGIKNLFACIERVLKE